MKIKSTLACAVATTALILAQAAPANAAYDHHWNGGGGSWHGGGGGWHGGGGHHNAGPILGLLAVGAAITIGAAELITAPVRAIGEAGQYGGGYDQGPQGYAQQSNYYPPQQQPYYAPQPQPYYAPPPPPYYYGRPAYYGRPVYYGG